MLPGIGGVEYLVHCGINNNFCWPQRITYGVKSVWTMVDKKLKIFLVSLDQV